MHDVIGLCKVINFGPNDDDIQPAGRGHVSWSKEVDSRVGATSPREFPQCTTLGMQSQAFDLQLLLSLSWDLVANDR